MVIWANQYIRLATRRKQLELDIWFIHQCINNNVVPVFARVKTSKNVPSTYVNQLQTKLLRKEIGKHYSKLDNINCNMKVMYNRLLQHFDNLDLTSFLHDVQDKVNHCASVKFFKLNNKLHNLIQQKSHLVSTNSSNNRSKFSNFKFHPRIKNLSNINFSQDELELLNHGLQFSIPTDISEIDLQELSIEIDIIIEKLSISLQQKNVIRNNCFKKLHAAYKNLTSNSHFHHPHHNSLKTLNSIKKKIKNHNLIISKSDKGNCLVILDHTEYINKVSTFLNNNGFIVLPHDPLNRFINKQKAFLKKYSTFFTDFHAPYYKIPSNPLIPRLYGLPKIHKEGIPIRPVVSFINTPVSIISKFILRVIKDITGFSPTFSIKNSSQLISKLNHIKLLPDMTMLSFDVSNLFTSVPKLETIQLVQDLLTSKSTNPSVITPIIEILSFCLSQDYFSFNNIFYKQPDGLAMGSCLSPFLADLFMNHLESTQIMTNNTILHWFRYVDDCLVFIRGNSNTAFSLLNTINNIHPNIKFTMELESNFSINFLDLSINRINNVFDYSIYRKPTQTDHVIHFNSNHPISHKLSAFNSFIHRLETIPLSNTNYIQELNIIKQIAFNNGYNPDIIHKLIYKKKRKLLQQSAYHNITSDSPSYFSLPFHCPTLSESIKNTILNSVENIKISFKVNNKLSRSLCNSKDSIDFSKRSGVYKLQCSDCDATYIGRTCRSLVTRAIEHSKLDNTSSFSHHLKYHNHTIKVPDDISLLHNIPGRDYLKLDLFEDLEIVKEKKNSPNCVNRHTSINRDFVPLHRQLFS
ncbi:uncharacterized protein [Diabrotica undecimpunctata]|uniref:uncharacterized protein n=1 Tax=Diabrotica undecimpunctata TaxID=50387 RepID=UPI003B634BD0